MSPGTIGLRLLDGAGWKYAAKHDGQFGLLFLNQIGPVGFVLGEGFDDQHMFAGYGRAHSGQCIKAWLGVTGDDDGA